MFLVRFVSFWLYPLLAALLFYLSVRSEPEWRKLIGLIPAGLLLWSILEYGMHRLLFHWETPNPKLRQLLLKLHLSHHGDPRDAEKILVRPAFSLPVSGIIFGLLYILTASFFEAAGLMAGMWLGFLYYDSVHYRLHMSISSGYVLRQQRRWHFYHHFVDDDHCFGVTSPLWDFVFRTYRSVKS